MNSFSQPFGTLVLVINCMLLIGEGSVLCFNLMQGPTYIAWSLAKYITVGLVERLCLQ